MMYPEKSLAKYELVEIETLIPYARNSKKHSDAQIAQIAASIKEFGFLSPLIISKDNTILCGHGRFYAAEKLGLKKLPCVREEYLTESQRRAFTIADNKIGENASWDDEMLAVELSDLRDDAFDLSLLGFDEKELSKYFDAGNDAQEDNFDVDAELEKPCFSQPGDIWHLGRHTVICGDSTLPETYEKLLGDTKVNLVLTDAPYFVDLNSASGKIQNDNLKDKEAYEFLMKAFSCFKNSMAVDASIYEFYATSKSRIFFDAFEDAGFKLGAGLIWHKDRAPLMRTDWKFDMEPILFGWRKDGKHKWYGDQKQKTVIEGFDSIKNSKTEGFGHPSSKPIGLLAYLMQQSTMTNGLVLDGFLGSASTLMACEQIGRTCYGIELEPKFVDVAVVRYVEFMGSTDDVYVIRNDEKIPYSELVKEDVQNDE